MKKLLILILNLILNLVNRRFIPNQVLIIKVSREPRWDTRLTNGNRAKNMQMFKISDAINKFRQAK